METEEETKVCPNCKREIPSSNLTIHVVHCSRNIGLCAVCKEPVPRSQLQEHLDTMHKLLPCKQCGEGVCGTDLEDHIRDSCALTIKSCRFCELELPRREIPAHEGYCGVRTEQCPDCREWVMIKYSQLHLDSNHGFIRLDDDPAPIVKKEVPKTNRLKLRTDNHGPSPGTSRSGDVFNRANDNGLRNDNGARNGIRSNGVNGSQNIIATTSQMPSSSNNVVNLPNTSSQASTSSAMPASQRGAIKKRPAPPPPAPQPAANPLRDLPYYSAAQRKQMDDKQRQAQNAYNLSAGLPPVLSAAEKLDKLRKMDALHNREIAEPDYRNCLNGRVWTPNDIYPGTVVGRHTPDQDIPPENRHDDSRRNVNDDSKRNVNADSKKNVKADSKKNVNDDSKKNVNDDSKKNVNDDSKMNVNGDCKKNANDNFKVDKEELERRKREFRNLEPMTPEEFMERFNAIQLNYEAIHENEWGQTQVEARQSQAEARRNQVEAGRNQVEAGQSNGDSQPSNVQERGKDRFSEIKSSLKELRRGLNEVTAPYNANANANVPIRPPSPVAVDNAPLNETCIPCEFCSELIPVDDLVLHETGCRPDLAQFRVRSPRGTPPPSPPRRVIPPPFDNEPVIPCEFCTEPLPYYLITEHQERCGREANLLYPD